MDEVEWERRTAEITDDGGKVIFKQENVEVPKTWSRAGDQDRGLEIFLRRIAQRHRSERRRETSVRQLISSRDADDCGLGHAGRLFCQQPGRRNFLRRTDLALREPIWRVQPRSGSTSGFIISTASAKAAAQGNWFYNPERPARPNARHPIRISAGSACFIQVGRGQHGRHHAPGVRARRCSSNTAPAPAPICPDSARTREKLSGGGRPSGPLSFLKVYDQVANVVKSPAARPVAPPR